MGKPRFVRLTFRVSPDQRTPLEENGISTRDPRAPRAQTIASRAKLIAALQPLAKNRAKWNLERAKAAHCYARLFPAKWGAASPKRPHARHQRKLRRRARTRNSDQKMIRCDAAGGRARNTTFEGPNPRGPGLIRRHSCPAAEGSCAAPFCTGPPKPVKTPCPDQSRGEQRVETKYADFRRGIFNFSKGLFW